MRKLFILLVTLFTLMFLLTCSPVQASSQSYWVKSYGGSGTDAITDVKVLPDESIIAVGYTNSTGAGDYDAFVMKLNPDGSVAWTKTYGGSNRDLAEAVAIADNGDIIVAGFTKSFGDGDSDVWVLRLDANGNVKWQKTYGGSDGEGAEAIAIADNGDIIVAGETGSFSTGGYDVWVLRLDENGNVKWQKTYGGKYGDGGKTVTIAPNGDIIVAGSTWSFSAGWEDDVWVLRLDENGNVKWEKTYGGGDFDWANAVAITPNGDIIVAGETWSFGTDDVWVLRLDEKGNIKWQKIYGGNNWDGARAVAVTRNGDIIVAGHTWSFGTGAPDSSNVWVLRLDANGNVKWQKTYGGSDGEGAEAIAIADNGDIIVAGETGSFSTGGTDAWLLRLPPDGNLSNCDFCGDSNAQITTPSPVINDSNATGGDSSAVVGSSTAYPQSWNPHVETQYSIVVSTTLTINSNPSGAHIYLDGSYVGTTPWEGTVSPGSHLLQITYPGYPAYSKLISAESGGDYTVNVDLTSLGGNGVLWRFSGPGVAYTTAVSDDGKFTVVGSGNYVVLLNSTGGPLWAYGTGDTVNAVDISSDGSVIAAASKDWYVYVFDRNGNLLWRYKTGWEAWSVDVSKDGQYIAVGSRDSYAYLFDRNGNLLWRYPSPGGIPSGAGVRVVKISDNNAYVAIGREDGKFFFLDINGNIKWSQNFGDDVSTIDMSSDGSRVVIGSYDNRVYFFDSSGHQLWARDLGSDVSEVDITPNGMKIAVGTWGGYLYYFRNDGSMPWKKYIFEGVSAVAITDDGKYVLAGNKGGSVYLYDLLGVLAWSNGLGSRVYSVAIAQSSSHMIAGDGDLYYFNPISTIELRQEAQDLINQAEEKIDYAKGRGIDVSEAEELLNWAKAEFDSGYYDKAKQDAQLAIQKADEAIQAAKEAAQEAISSAESKIGEAKSLGLDVSSAEDLLNQAKDLFNNEYYPSAKQKAGEAYSIAETEIMKYKATQAINNATQALQEAQNAGADVSKAQSILQQAQDAYSSGDYHTAIDLAKKAESAARAAEAIHNAEEKISWATDRGIDVSDANELLNQAKTAFSSEDYDKASQLAAQALNEAESVIESEREAALNAIRDAEESLRMANLTVQAGEENGIDVSGYRSALTKLEEDLQDAQNKYDTGYYPDAKRIAEGVKSQADLMTQQIDSQLSDLRDDAWSAIQDANSTIEWAVSHGISVETAQEKLSSALEEFNKKHYPEAKSTALQAKEEAQNSITAAKNKAAKAIEDARSEVSLATQTLKALKEAGLTFPSQETKLMNANSTLKSAESLFAQGFYADAEEKAKEAYSMASSVISELSNSVQEKAGTAINEARSCINSAKSQNIHVKNAEALLNSAESALSQENYLGALLNATSAKEECSKTVALSQDASKVIQSASTYLGTLEGKGMGCPAGENLINQSKNAQNSGDYERAKELADQAMKELSLCEQMGNGVLEDINSAQSKIDELKGKGYNVAEAEDYLEQARQALKKGEFGNASSLAQMALSKAQDIEKTCEGAYSKIAEAERAIQSAKAQGFNPSKAENILKDAQEKFHSGECSAAIPLAEDAIKAANDVDGDGMPNSSDPFPTVNNYLVYGVAGLLIVMFVVLLRKLLWRRRLNSVYEAITRTYASLSASLVPDEASEELKRLAEIVNEAGDLYKAGDIKGLRRLRDEAISLETSIKAKIKEYNDLKGEIIEAINRILGGVSGGEENAEH